MGLRPTQGNENWVRKAWLVVHLICHLDRSEAEWRDLRFKLTIGMPNAQLEPRELDNFAPP